MTPSCHDAPTGVSGADGVTISTRDSRRAVRFYCGALGFEVVSRTRARGALRISLRGHGCTGLVIDEHCGAVTLPRHLRLETADLDYARERLWNLGVALADGCVESRFDPERDCRWLPVRDPDGNEIELFEQCPRNQNPGASHVARLAGEELAALEL